METSQNIRVFEVHAKHEGGYAEFACPEKQSILSAMEKAGLAVVPVGCRGGGCGVCKIAIESGEFNTGKMSKAHITDEDIKTASVSLACQTYPKSAIKIRPIGKVFKKFQQTKSPSGDGFGYTQGG